MKRNNIKILKKNDSGIQNLNNNKIKNKKIFTENSLVSKSNVNIESTKNNIKNGMIKRLYVTPWSPDDDEQIYRFFNSLKLYIYRFFNSINVFIFGAEKQYTWRKIFFRIFLLVLNLAVLFGFFYLFIVDWSNLNWDGKILLSDKYSWYEEGIKRKLITYKNIWDTQQWVVSLIGLFVLYAVLIILLNWTGLTRPITRWEGFFLIFFDLLLNFIVGLSYMGYHNTIIGGLMLQCPIALSPFILAIELTIYAIYVFWKKQNP